MKSSGLPASLQDDLYLKDIKATNATVTPVLNSIGICQGVLNVGSRHCTGNKAIALFKKEYGKIIFKQVLEKCWS